MKKLLINLIAGVVLFAGALIGGLAATGRLNHDGTANIPLLSKFFPAPPEAPAGGEAGKDGKAAEGKDAHAAPAGETKNADLAGEKGKPVDASANGEGQQPQGDEKPRRTVDGKSVVNPEKPAEGGEHGGGHGGGEGEKGGEHGAEKGGHGEAPKEGHGAAEPEGHAAAKPAGHAAERDFAEREQALANDRKNKYAPGGLFTFEGMPSGLTADQLNAAWAKVKEVQADLDKRKASLDLREQSLQMLNEDVSKRQKDLAAERLALETKMRELDERIAKFQEQVKLVRNDEIAGLKKNAQTYASFEPSKSAELLAAQWSSEKGQEEVLKTLEFMDKDKVNEILNAMTNPMVQEVMRKRLRVSREAAPSGAPGK